MKKELLKADYTVYFEIYGKKMKVTILAENEIYARSKVMNKLTIHKVIRSRSSFNEAVDIMEDIFQFLDKK